MDSQLKRAGILITPAILFLAVIGISLFSDLRLEIKILSGVLSGLILIVYLGFINTGKSKLIRQIINENEILLDKDAELRAECRKYQQLSENIEDLIFAISPDGKVIYISPTVKEFSGHTIEQVIDSHIGNYFVNPDEFENTLRTFNEVVTEQHPASSEFLYKPAVGREPFYMEVNARPIVEKGQTISVFCVGRNIDARKKAEMALVENQRAMTTLLSNLPGMAYRCFNDPDWTMEFVSDGCKALTGYDTADLIGNKKLAFAEIIHEDDRPMVWDLAQRGINAKQTFTLQYRIVTASGNIKWAREQGQGVYDKYGQLTALEGFISDVTDKWLAEEALKESEQKFRLLSEQSVLGIGIIQNDAFVYLNQALADICEHSIEQIMNWSLGEFIKKLIYEEDVPFVAEQARKKQVGEKDAVATYEFRVTTQSGTIKWVEIYSRTVNYLGNAADLLSLTDITTRKNAEEAVQKKTEEWRSLVQNAPDTIVTLDRDGNILFMNRTETGEPVENLIGKSIYDHLPENYREVVSVFVGNVFDRGQIYSYETNIISPDGQNQWFHNRIGPVTSNNKVVAAVNISTNITGRIRTNEALQHRVDMETIIAEISSRFINLELDNLDKSISNALARICDYIGADRGNVFQISDEENSIINTHEWCSFESGSTKEHLRELPLGKFSWCEEKLRNNHTIYLSDIDDLPPQATAEKELLKSLSVKSIVSIPLIVGSTLVGFIGFSTSLEKKDWPEEDIAQLKIMGEVIINSIMRTKSEQEIREREATFRAISSSAQDAIVMMDNNGIITFWNESAAKMFGCSADKTIGTNLHQLLAPKRYHEAHLKAFGTFKGTGQGDMVGKTMELSALHKSGNEFPIELSLSSLRLHNQWHALGFMRDITDRKQAEKQKLALQEKLDKAERMESLGILAGGVAHDLNNMLGPLVGYPELILRKLDNDSPIRKQVERIGNSARDAADVIQDLLTLARRGRYQMQPTSLNEVIESYLDSPSYTRLCERFPSVQVDVNLDRSIGFIDGSSAHLAKVIMNLIVNAFDAMPEGGRLFISSRQAYVEKLLDGHININQGDYVIISVRDTGMGIAPEDMGKIFEPYYSNKKMGTSGSGLGLSVVYGIAKDHKGYYDINSEVGKGTEFIFYFPIMTKGKETEFIREMDITGTETILVVDDVKDQRDVSCELLDSLGYKVHKTANGHEALQFLKENEVDLVILDMIMEKDFDGLDTYTEIIEIRPDQKAIITSGFSATDRVLKMQKLGAGQYIKKPFTLKTIGEAVRIELDKKEPVAVL